jgi:hypothetical protein
MSKQERGGVAKRMKGKGKGRVGLGPPGGSPQNCLRAFSCKNDVNPKFLHHIEINFKIGGYTRIK